MSSDGVNIRMKERIRRAVAGGLYHSGLLSAVRKFESGHAVRLSGDSKWPRIQRFPESKFGILCYHRVGTEGVPIFSRLNPSVFEAQMRYIKKNYRVVPL